MTSSLVPFGLKWISTPTDRPRPAAFASRPSRKTDAHSFDRPNAPYAATFGLILKLTFKAFRIENRVASVGFAPSPIAL